MGIDDFNAADDVGPADSAHADKEWRMRAPPGYKTLLQAAPMNEDA